MTEKKAATAPAPAAAKKRAAAPAAKRRESGETGGGEAANGEGETPNHGDLISDLPDAILATIISLLPTKDGARTQALARRWRPLWRSAPLNLDVDNLGASESECLSIVSKILSDHHGPARRFVFTCICLRKGEKVYAQMESWFHAPALDGLQELRIAFSLREYSACYEQPEKRYALPPSVLRLASTLRLASIGACDFPKEVAPSLNFPFLKQLTLWRIFISEDVFRGVLSSCSVLEALKLEKLRHVGCLRISSPTLRIIVIDDLCKGKGELVIEDTPGLERLLLRRPGLGGEIIRVVRAPKLEILGLLSPRISEIETANLVFQGLTPSSSKNPIHTVKVLALKFSRPDLDGVLDILRCFPCLEKLYVIWDGCINTEMNSVRQYDPLYPIKCLESHLKVVVLKNYEGGEEDVAFAKFFVLNAKVVKEIKFRVCEKIYIDKKWVIDQHRLLEVKLELPETLN
ncbi:hypothetical protein ACQ4PT_032261 [Festuca glaucescens]